MYDTIVYAYIGTRASTRRVMMAISVGLETNTKNTQKLQPTRPINRRTLYRRNPKISTCVLLTHLVGNRHATRVLMRISCVGWFFFD